MAQDGEKKKGTVYAFWYLLVQARTGLSLDLLGSLKQADQSFEYLYIFGLTHSLFTEKLAWR
jgi:hypothetical protein